MDNISENVDLIKGLVKNNMKKYGDLLVNLYEKVKGGGALETTSQERKILYSMANRYGQLQGFTKPINEVGFTNLFNAIRDNVVLQQMVQWGGGKNLNMINTTRPRNPRYHNSSSIRVKPLYRNYISNYQYS